eukprot:gene2128-1552_t
MSGTADDPSAGRKSSSLLNPVRLVKSLRAVGDGKDRASLPAYPDVDDVSASDLSKRREVQSMRLPRTTEAPGAEFHRPLSSRTLSTAADGRSAAPLRSGDEKSRDGDTAGGKLRGLIAKVGSKVTQTFASGGAAPATGRGSFAGSAGGSRSRIHRCAAGGCRVSVARRGARVDAAAIARSVAAERRGRRPWREPLEQRAASHERPPAAASRPPSMALRPADASPPPPLEPPHEPQPQPPLEEALSPNVTVRGSSRSRPASSRVRAPSLRRPSRADSDPPAPLDAAAGGSGGGGRPRSLSRGRVVLSARYSVGARSERSSLQRRPGRVVRSEAADGDAEPASAAAEPVATPLAPAAEALPVATVAEDVAPSLGGLLKSLVWETAAALDAAPAAGDAQLLLELCSVSARLCGRLAFHLGDAAGAQWLALARLVGLAPAATATSASTASGSRPSRGAVGGRGALLGGAGAGGGAVLRMLCACLAGVAVFAFDAALFGATPAAADDAAEAERRQRQRVEAACGLCAVALGAALCLVGGEVATRHRRNAASARVASAADGRRAAASAAAGGSRRLSRQQQQHEAQRARHRRRTLLRQSLGALQPAAPTASTATTATTAAAPPAAAAELQLLREPSDEELRREREEALRHGDMWVALQTLRDDAADVLLVLRATQARPDVLRHVHRLLAQSTAPGDADADADGAADGAAQAPSDAAKLTALDVAVLVLQTVDPQRVSRALLVLGSRLAAVLLALRFSFAQTVALAQSLSALLARVAHALLDVAVAAPPADASPREPQGRRGAARLAALRGDVRGAVRRDVRRLVAAPRGRDAAGRRAGYRLVARSLGHFARAGGSTRAPGAVWLRVAAAQGVAAAVAAAACGCSGASAGAAAACRCCRCARPPATRRARAAAAAAPAAEPGAAARAAARRRRLVLRRRRGGSRAARRRRRRLRRLDAAAAAALRL